MRQTLISIPKTNSCVLYSITCLDEIARSRVYWKLLVNEICYVLFKIWSRPKEFGLAEEELLFLGLFPLNGYCFRQIFDEGFRKVLLELKSLGTEVGDELL